MQGRREARACHPLHAGESNQGEGSPAESHCDQSACALRIRGARLYVEIKPGTKIRAKEKIEALSSVIKYESYVWVHITQSTAVASRSEVAEPCASSVCVVWRSPSKTLTPRHRLLFRSVTGTMQTRMLLLLGCALLVAWMPATEGFSPSAGLARDLTRGRMQMRSPARRNTAALGLRMQAQAEPPKDPG